MTNIEKNISDKIFELGTAGDIKLFIELIMTNEIILYGNKETISKKAIDIFCGEEKQKEEFEKKKTLLDNLLSTYNNYILEHKEKELYTAYNEIYLDKLLEQDFLQDDIQNNDIKLYNIEKTLTIIVFILSKYIEHKENDVSKINETNFILNWKELLDISDLILEIVNILRIKKISNNQLNFLLKNIFELSLVKNESIIGPDEINTKKGKLYIPIYYFIFETDFYVEFLEEVNMLLDFSLTTNILFLDNIENKINNELKNTSNNKINGEKDELIKTIIDASSVLNIKEIIISIKTQHNIPIIKHHNPSEIKKDEEEKEHAIIVEKNVRSYKNLTDINSKLKENVIGQCNIIDNIINKHIKKLLLGFNKRPISLLFIGESGVGKTELGKQIGSILGGKSLHIPMGNYNESHTGAALLGAPPGYLGNGEKTILEKYIIDCQENNTTPVFIFDEIEKGHSNLQNMYLELLDEGKITFLSGDVYELNNSVVIMTSNLGLENINKKMIGFGIDENNHNEKEERNKDIFLKAVSEFFKPEILNRINDVFVFNKLKDKDKKDIFNKVIKEQVLKLQNNKIVQKIFGNKIEKINISKIKKQIQKDIDINNLDNIRKIENLAEHHIIDFLENN